MQDHEKLRPRFRRGVEGGRGRRPVGGRARRPVCSIESLEGRRLLSATYSITDLGTLGGATSSASGINASGQVVGAADTGALDKSGHAIYHAFLYNGKMIDLKTPGGNTSQARSINDGGQVAGVGLNASGVYSAFLYSGGSLSTLGTLAGPGKVAIGFARAINNAGQVVGDSQNAVLKDHATLFGIRPVDLGTLGGSSSQAAGINASGTIVGTSQTTAGPRHVFTYSGGHLTDLHIAGAGAAINASNQIVGTLDISSTVQHAFSYAGGKVTDLGTLGGASSFALGLNASGQVVGDSLVPGSSTPHAFLYSGGKMVDLNTLIAPGSKWVLEYATGINANGQIAGTGISPNGKVHAFELTVANISAQAGFTITSTRTASAVFAGYDVVTFFARNNGVGGQAETTKLLAEDSTLSSTGGLLIRTIGQDTADLSGQSTVGGSYIRIGNSFTVVGTTPRSPVGFHDQQLITQFEVAGAQFGGVTANVGAGIAIAVAVVPHGSAVHLSGMLAAEHGPVFTYLIQN